MHSTNRKQLIGLAIAILVILFMIEAWVAPPSQEVHSFGGTPIQVVAYAKPSTANVGLQWQPGPPTESLSDIKCREFAASQPECGPAEIAALFPNLKQTPSTLYYVWTGCVDWSGAGPIIPWYGFNAEYFSSSRTLVLHCYVGTGLLYFPERLFGSVGQGGNTLLAIPTSAMGGGTLRIREDDRLEHLVGNTSTEYDLTTATIS